MFLCICSHMLENWNNIGGCRRERISTNTDSTSLGIVYSLTHNIVSIQQLNISPYGNIWRGKKTNHANIEKLRISCLYLCPTIGVQRKSWLPTVSMIVRDNQRLEVIMSGKNWAVKTLSCMLKNWLLRTRLTMPGKGSVLYHLYMFVGDRIWNLAYYKHIAGGFQLWGMPEELWLFKTASTSLPKFKSDIASSLCAVLKYNECLNYECSTVKSSNAVLPHW